MGSQTCIIIIIVVPRADLQLHAWAWWLPVPLPGSSGYVSCHGPPATDGCRGSSRGRPRPNTSGSSSGGCGLNYRSSKLFFLETMYEKKKKKLYGVIKEGVLTEAGSIIRTKTVLHCFETLFVCLFSGSRNKVLWRNWLISLEGMTTLRWGLLHNIAYTSRGLGCFFM